MKILYSSIRLWRLRLFTRSIARPRPVDEQMLQSSFARRNTLCTVVAFDSVATAIAECAFVVSELPVVLSLEVKAARLELEALCSTLDS